MNINTLLSLIKIRGLSQSELARRTGVSRQAISAWRRKAVDQGAPDINVYSHTQDKLAEVLGLKTEELNKALPNFDSTEILWDKAFVDIESFVVALVRNDLRAMARLVQIYGLYASARMLGKKVWHMFPRYRSHIHPAYRKHLEAIWTLEQSLI